MLHFSLTLLISLAVLYHSVNAQVKCNGWAEFCDKRFNDVALPSTHNSFASLNPPAPGSSLIPGDLKVPSSPFANQNAGWDIKAQLEDGISKQVTNLKRCAWIRARRLSGWFFSSALSFQLHIDRRV
jgi:hypothetical protein